MKTTRSKSRTRALALVMLPALVALTSPSPVAAALASPTTGPTAGKLPAGASFARARVFEARSGSDTVRLSLEAAPGQNALSIELEPLQLVQPGAMLRRLDGTSETREPLAAARYLVSTEAEEQFGTVALRSTGISGWIRSGARYFAIEPASRYRRGADNRQVVVYEQENPGFPGDCGIELAEHTGRRRALRHSGAARTHDGGDPVELAVSLVGDSAFEGLYGLDSTDRMLDALAGVAATYLRDLNIQLSIAEILLVTGSDPWTAATDPTDLINNFRDWLMTPATPDPAAGVVHLFTGVDLDGSVIGIAFTGHLCTIHAVGLTQATFTTLGETAVVAHEIGHNLGAGHDGSVHPITMVPNTCSSSGFLMASVGSVSKPAKQFSSCSVDEITPWVDARPACLPTGSATCGDSTLDIPAEVCDDGNTTSGDGCASDCTAEEAQSKSQQKCLNGLAKNGAKVLQGRNKLTQACLKRAQSAKTNDPDACVASDTGSKVAKAEAKVFQAHTKSCSPPPGFGLRLLDPINDGYGDAGAALMSDLFGGSLNTAFINKFTDKTGAQCQLAVQKTLDKLANTQTRLVNDCYKAGLKSGSIDDSTAMEACINAISDDVKGKVAKTEAKLAAAFNARCQGVTQATAFPGTCSGAGDFPGCLAAAARCRVCQGVNTSAAVGSDCDVFDDGLGNGSCS